MIKRALASDPNTTGGSGGAISNHGQTSLLRSLVLRNTAAVNGGGIFDTPPAIHSVTLQRVERPAERPGQLLPAESHSGVR